MVDRVIASFHMILRIRKMAQPINQLVNNGKMFEHLKNFSQYGALKVLV
jgi:hypothetical protein